MLRRVVKSETMARLLQEVLVVAALFRVSIVPYSTAQYCVAGWVLCVASTVNLRRGHSYLILDSILHGPFCCMFINFFCHPNFLVPTSSPRKRESSPERGSKKGRGADEEAPLDVSRHTANLWTLICDGRITLKTQGDHKFLSCPSGFYWSRWFRVKDLYIRRCYEDLYKARIEAEDEGKGKDNGKDKDESSGIREDDVEMICGTSGIGKSTYIWYVLYRLMDAFRKDTNKDKTLLKFIWVTRNEGTYILDSDGGCVEKENNTEFPPSVDYCFIDMGLNFSLPNKLPYVECSKTLVVASSKSKERGLPLLLDEGIDPFPRFMPVWSREEMEIVAKSVFGRDFNSDSKIFEGLYLILGGSLHSCLKMFASRNSRKLVGANGPVGAADSNYDAASAKFVELLKTSASLVHDDIPATVEKLLKRADIKRSFASSAMVFFGKDVTFDDISKAGPPITHIHSNAPKHTNQELRLSSRFAELYLKELELTLSSSSL